MAESERIFAAIRNVSPGDVYVTSFANKEELAEEVKNKKGAIELVDSSTDYNKILAILEEDSTPSLVERIVINSTDKAGKLNPRSLIWFLKKTK